MKHSLMKKSSNLVLSFLFLFVILSCFNDYIKESKIDRNQSIKILLENLFYSERNASPQDEQKSVAASLAYPQFLQF